MNGIFYSKELLPKVLDGTKTITRRTDGLKEINESCSDNWQLVSSDLEGYFRFSCIDLVNVFKYVKPRWPLHSIQYIREPFAPQLFVHCLPYAYPNWQSKDNTWHTVVYKLGTENYAWGLSGEPEWRSPYAMRETSARWFQQIVDVRPERLTLSLANDDFTQEGGKDAWKYLEPMFGLWVFRYEFKLLRREEVDK
jgi:hypothetical protein